MKLSLPASGEPDRCADKLGDNDRSENGVEYGCTYQHVLMVASFCARRHPKRCRSGHLSLSTFTRAVSQCAIVRTEMRHAQQADMKSLGVIAPKPRGHVL